MQSEPAPFEQQLSKDLELSLRVQEMKLPLQKKVLLVRTMEGRVVACASEAEKITESVRLGKQKVGETKESCCQTDFSLDSLKSILD